MMRDAYEVLYQKEADLTRVRQEVESLKMAASLLADDSTSEIADQPPDDPDKKPASSAEETLSPQLHSEATGTDGPFSARLPRAAFWSAFIPRT